MAFILDKRIITSDEGFSVQLIGMNDLKYIEAADSIMIYHESSYPPYRENIWLNSIKLYESSGKKVSESDRARIAENIRRALQFAGAVDVQIE